MRKPKKADLVVVATAKSRRGEEAELLDALLDVAAPTRAQPRCVSFARSEQDPSVVTALERWASVADHENHHKGAHVARLMVAMGPAYEIMDEID